MAKIKHFLFMAIFCLPLILPAKSFAQNTQDFSFASFDADYYLKQEADNSSTMAVNETLVASFPSYDQNHGILRAIPEVYDGHKLHLENISVTQNGQPAEYTKSDQNNNLVLKIGDASTYVHGLITYKINYTLHDVIKFFPDHDELFWDINGDQWQQNFSSVTARMHVPVPLAKSMQSRQKCYAGPAGSLAQNCTIIRSDADDESIITASAANIGPAQTLSVVLGFNQGTFKLSQTVQKEQQRQKIELIVTLILWVVLPLFALLFMFSRWREFGNDPKGRGVIIPEYEPPKGFNPLSSDFMLKEGLRPQAFSAALIDMAVNGYITIIEVPKSGLFGKKDYELRLNRAPEETFSQHMKTAMTIIFGADLAPGRSAKISDFRKSVAMQQNTYKSMKSLEDSLAADLAAQGYFKKDPKKVRTGYQVWSIVLFFVSWFSFSGAIKIHFTPLIGLTAGMIAASAIVFLFSFIMSARTEAGVGVHDDLLGLKDYIKLAEADRLKFLQSPEGAEKLPLADQFDPKTPEAKVRLFEKLLPYSILFGLEKDWAKQFEGIYTNPPGWYQGGNWSAFNTGYLIGSLDDFNSASAMSFASPSSSSGSGFSGGGAGGGGGGGGGGGW